MSQSALARLLGCDPSMVNKIEKGSRTVRDLDLAHLIERLTAGWAKGPIRMQEWLVVQHDSTTVARASGDREGRRA